MLIKKAKSIAGEPGIQMYGFAKETVGNIETAGFISKGIFEQRKRTANGGISRWRFFVCMLINYLSAELTRDDITTMKMARAAMPTPRPM